LFAAKPSIRANSFQLTSKAYISLQALSKVRIDYLSYSNVVVDLNYEQSGEELQAWRRRNCMLCPLVECFDFATPD